MYPKSVLSRKKENITIFHLKIVIITDAKIVVYCLYRHVNVIVQCYITVL